MAAHQTVSTQIKETVTTANRALNSENVLFYDDFDNKIRQLEALARETFQAKLKGDYRSILNKLENGAALTGEEHELVKLLVVGEAKYYLRHENDLENWQNELARLVEEIEQIEAKGLDDIDSLLHLQALCRDARGVLPDITFYYREKERIERFEKAMSGPIDAESSRILADVIRGMMESKKM